MELTKQNRHELYVHALNDIEQNKQVSCCSSFFYSKKITNELIAQYNASDFVDKSHELFPELFALAKSKFGFWFSGKQERIEALKKCIEQTKP